MNETKRKTEAAEEMGEIEAVVRRESAEALRRFRADDFEARMIARLAASPPPRRPGLLVRKPALVAAFGVFVFAAAAVMFFFPRGARDGRLESGLRIMTEALSRSEVLKAVQSRAAFEILREPSGGGDAHGLAAALLRIASQPGSAAVEGAAPPRPRFSPEERFKILYEDRVILRVLAGIANQKEI